MLSVQVQPHLMSVAHAEEEHCLSGLLLAEGVVSSVVHLHDRAGMRARCLVCADDSEIQVIRALVRKGPSRAQRAELGVTVVVVPRNRAELAAVLDFVA